MPVLFRWVMKNRHRKSQRWYAEEQEIKERLVSQMSLCWERSISPGLKESRLLSLSGNLILSCLSSQTSEGGWNRTEINHEAWSGKAVNYSRVENGGTHGNRDESQRFNGTRSCSLLFILVMQHVYLFLSK